MFISRTVPADLPTALDPFKNGPSVGHCDLCPAICSCFGRVQKRLSQVLAAEDDASYARSVRQKDAS